MELYIKCPNPRCNQYPQETGCAECSWEGFIPYTTSGLPDTNEVYKKVMGHDAITDNFERGSFSWGDINNLMVEYASAALLKEQQEKEKYMIGFADWLSTNAMSWMEYDALEEGEWYVNGEMYTTEELLQKYLKEKV